jgi:hypothetical protein
MTYATIQPPFRLAFREMPKEELNRYFEWFMEVRSKRLNELARAVKQTSGYEEWQPDGTPASLDTLGKWLSEQVDVRARTVKELEKIEGRLVFPMDVSGEELTTRTLSLAMDVGIYLSEVLLKNHPVLQWDQPLGNKKFIDYGQPVLIKFRPGPFNPVRMVVTLAYGLVSKQKTAEGLRNIYDIWSKLIQPASKVTH